jgi:broad specificity phosphatase PhoE
MKRLVIALLLLFVAINVSAQITTIVIVRHAEKVSDDSDAALSDIGKVRADELARVLAGSHVSAIYVTQFIRTQQTAAPAAKAMSLTPTIIKASDTYAHDVAAHIKKKHGGETVLVISHSDRIGPLMKALGIKNVPAFTKTQYDDLFVVTLANGKAKLTSLRYGDVAR